VKVGAQIVAAAFLIAGAAMVLGVFGADTGTGRVVCLVLALTFLPLGFLFLRLGGRFGNIANLTATRRNGELGRATVLQVDDTGIVINDTTGVAHVRLAVEVASRPAYEVDVTETLPQHELARLTPGRTVAVWVDRNDADKVAIDIRRRVPRIAAGAMAARAARSAVAAAAPDDAYADDYARAEARESAILAHGAAARATVIRTTDAPGDAAPGPRLVAFELNVQPDGGGPPYLVSVRHTVPDSVAEVPAPGMQLALRVDPDDHAAVAIDWRAAAG
jgi:hypothetical protein